MRNAVALQRVCALHESAVGIIIAQNGDINVRTERCRTSLIHSRSTAAVDGNALHAWRIIMAPLRKLRSMRHCASTVHPQQSSCAGGAQWQALSESLQRSTACSVALLRVHIVLMHCTPSWVQVRIKWRMQQTLTPLLSRQVHWNLGTSNLGGCLTQVGISKFGSRLWPNNRIETRKYTFGT